MEIDHQRKLASDLGCMIEEDFCQLFAVTPNTLRAWRNRGKAPRPVLIGNRYFYPLAAIRQVIIERTKDEIAHEVVL